MLKSNGAFCAVSFMEVVRISESPLREVPLYVHMCEYVIEDLVIGTSAGAFLLFMQDHTIGEKQPVPESCTMAVLEMLPLVNCVKPKDVLLHMTRGTPAAEGTQNPFTETYFLCSFLSLQILYLWMSRSLRAPYTRECTSTSDVTS